VKCLRPLWLLLLAAQFSSAQSTFTKPSEAYDYARRPLTEWEAAIYEHKQPVTLLAPENLVWQRLRTLCPSFTVESVNGSEVFWLAKLCEQDAPKALLAVQRYLAGSELTHAPDARFLMAMLQMRTTGNWEASWETIRTILREDPIQPVAGQIDSVIDDEARANPKKALEWSKERYSLLLDRSENEKPGTTPVAPSYVLSAGSDLVHRYYMAGETAPAVKVLDELNNFAKSNPDETADWGARLLHWANLEMHPPPAIPAVKMLRGNFSSDLIRPGRVELISFFFLGCYPCMRELPHLDALQKQYGEKKLLVTDVTSYKVNLHTSGSDHSIIDAALQKALLDSAPSIGVIITSDETLAGYGVKAFPVVAVVDKVGRLRYIGIDANLDEDAPVGHLIRQLIEE
jgi:thiol-disulfide isomerase/thioredoxin